MTINSRSAKLSSPNVKIQDVPNVPTIGTAVVNVDTIQVPFTPATTGGQAAVYRAVSSPGGIEAISYGSSPILISNLDDGVARTFTVRGETSTGATTGFSAASNSVTVPKSAIVPIVSIVGDGTQSGYVFNNIPQGYQDLMVVATVLATGSTSNYYGFSINDRANWSRTTLYGNGSSSLSNRTTSQNQLFLQAGNNGIPTNGANPITSIIHILNYANTTTLKTVLSRTSFDQNGSGEVNLTASLHYSTAATTSVSIQTDNGGTYLTPATRISIYGIKAVGQ
jgi:hypothetical protein